MTRESGRIFLLGAHGWLGRAIGEALLHVQPVARADDLAGAALGGPTLTSADLIVNAAGSKDPATMQQANADLVARLVELAGPARVPIVHLGSAAEYGIPDSDAPLAEDPHLERPSTEYGRTKLEGTRHLRQYGNACVLRLFNIVENPPQPRSPLQDVYSKALAGISGSTPPELWAAQTRRDWVTRGFVVKSVAAAARLRPIGVYNICSGTAVAMGDLVRALLDRCGSDLPVLDLHKVAANTIVGDPRAWYAASGLREQLTAEAIAALLVPTEEVRP